MAEKTAPLFRKSMKGYKKQDVNNFILRLNRTMEEKEASYVKTIEEYKQNAENDRIDILELEGIVKKQEALINELYEKIAAADNASLEKDTEIESLRHTVEDLHQKLSESGDTSDEDREKAEYYDSICSKAGEILFIASGTAETILNRANDEAQRIVGSANSKKDLMLKTLSDSVDAAADDINSYIKSAVEECIKKIDASVKEVTEMADTRKTEKPKATFIHGN